MGVKYMKDGGDFEYPREFGFHGSAGTTHVHGHTRGAGPKAKYAKGGHHLDPDVPADETKEGGERKGGAVRMARGGHHKGEKPTKHAGGGMHTPKPRLPRAFKPAAGRFRSAIGSGKTPTVGAARQMPAGPVGALPYGTTGSDEPEMPDQGIPQMKHGGRHSSHRGKRR